MTGHTPGPWKIGGAHNSIIAQNETGWDDDKNVQTYNGHLVCESIKWEANARLIAAAPELLEAAKYMSAYDDAERPDSHMTNLRISFGQARALLAAIAKAEGSS